jgi:NTE family protein
LFAALQHVKLPAVETSMRKSDQEKTVVVLQGGGALGAYQAGAYEALAEAGFMPDWIAGISIGAINGALIAGNKPEQRVEKLRAFWEKVSSGLQGSIPFLDEMVRPFFNEASANLAASFGIPGFFAPRIPPAPFQPNGTPEAISYYDTAPLARTLADLVDFNWLNNKGPRLSVGAVDVKLGNFEYFDSKKQTLDARHIMASGALPPAFAPVEIDRKWYWDGSIVSNTPIDYVMEYAGPPENMVIFQVDVFRARGDLPATMGEVTEREKDIRFSSRTRFNSNHVKKLQEMSNAAAKLYAKLPEDLKNDPDATILKSWACQAHVTVAHLIRRDTGAQTGSKDYEFSRISVEEHWETGRANVRKGLKCKEWTGRSRQPNGVQVIDLTKSA